jgi:SAM-dependent methyltransferase
MTLQRSSAAARFSNSADAYASTMAPALRPVAEEVVRRAVLAPGERVLDIGTGTGTAAALAAGDGRRVVGLDAAPGMLAIARRDVPDLEFVEHDFTSLPFDDGAWDVVLAVHSLLFADDRVAALREWHRVVRPGGRISLSVPGPGGVTPISLFAPVYDRYGLPWNDDYPTLDDLAGCAAVAGWSEVRTDADASISIPLRDAAHFREWLTVGARGTATADWDAARHEQFAQELMGLTPRSADGGYRIPFGALYLTARS